MPTPPSPSPLPTRSRLAHRAPALLLCLSAVVLTLLPLIALLSSASLTAQDSFPLSAQAIASSLACAIAIALLASTLALPLAYSLRVTRPSLLVALALPLLLPSYLVSFCLTLLVQPQSSLGAWLAIQGQTTLPWLPGFVMQAIAFIGLAAWLCPLAVLLLLPALRSLPPTIFDSLKLDASRSRRALVLLRMLASPLALCIALLTVLMLGSAVPLHLANAPTLAVKAWAAAILSPASLDPWLVSSPLLCIACIASAVFTRALSRSSYRASLHTPADDTLPSRPSRQPLALLFAVPALLVALPLIAAFFNIKKLSSLPAFFHVAHPAMLSSAALALLAATGLAGLLTLAMRLGPLHTTSRTTHCALALLLAWSFVPGILVGQAYSALVQALPAQLTAVPLTSTLLLALAHISRFAGLFVALGFFFASLEPADRRDARSLDRASSIQGWFLAASFGSSRSFPALPLAAFAAAACLSLHEIECTIMLQLPGTGSIGQTMLANLHFARSEELCAGILTITLLSLLPAGLLVGLLSTAFPKNKRSTIN